MEDETNGKEVADTHITGNLALTQAMQQFQRLYWGPVSNDREDAGSGIDMFISARDKQRIDLGLLVSAQVKGGPSYFNEPGESEGKIGWYFRIDAATLKSWTRQPVPHLVILCDLKTETSYWVHVTREAAIPTGKGWKLLVSSDQRIDEANRTKLEAIAASATIQASSLTGSAWAPPAHLGEDDLWRCALVAPRLVAPHPNLGHGGGLTPVQGVALITAARTHDYVHFAEAHEDIPGLTEAAEHESSGWRFVWAMHAWFSRREIEPLKRAVDSATTSHEFTTAVVATVSALIELEEFDDAELMLDAALARDVLSKEIDRCWLLVQKARVLGELGRSSEAVESALDAYTRLHEARGIPATAIRAAAVAAWWRFAGAWRVRARAEETGDGTEDGSDEHEPASEGSPSRGLAARLGLEDVIVGSDNHVSWWRAQMVSGALSQYLKDEFLEWTQAKLNRLSLYDATRVGLQAATRTASYAGDAGSAAASACSLARYDMMVATTEAEVYQALNDLRRLGDEEAVKHAAAHLWQSGPLGVLREASRDLLNAKRWSRSSCLVNLRMWMVGGDLLTESETDEAIAFCRSAYGDPDHVFSVRARGGFHQADELIEAIAALAPAASADAQTEVAKWFMSVCEAEPLDGLREMSAAKLLRAIRWTAVFEAVRGQWLDWAIERASDDRIATLLLAELAQTTAIAKDALVVRAQGGNLTALIRGWPDDRPIPESVARPLVTRLSAHLHKRIGEMEAHSYVWEGHNRATQLAWLNVRCPSVADWAMIERYLLHPAVPMDDKSGICHYLASHEVEIPEEVMHRLTEDGELIETGHEGFFGADDGSLRSAALALRYKLGDVGNDHISAEVLKLVSSRSSADRVVAARTVRDVNDAALSPHLLLPLLADEDIAVAIAAASGIARRASLAPADMILQHALIATLQMSGASLPSVALGWIDTSRDLQDNVVEAVRAAATHPSASVRTRAEKVLAILDASTPDQATAP